MKYQIVQGNIDLALKESLWDLGNQWLYSLCQTYPKYDIDSVIIAKIWLIGRSYASAIERRLKAQETSDEFYENKVAKAIRRSGLDRWLASLPGENTDLSEKLKAAIYVHKQLQNLFRKITGLDKRSLASKYLHFHRPDLFFLYDSRAKKAISMVTPRTNKLKEIRATSGDSEYQLFCRRALYLSEDITTRFKVTLTPRQIDKMLLRLLK
jgi:hypothetical protein